MRLGLLERLPRNLRWSLPRGRALRRPALQVAAVLTVFAVALVLWVRGLAGDPGSGRHDAGPNASPSATSSTTPGADSSSGPAGGSGTGASGLGTGNGLQGFPFPLATDVNVVGPGDHQVILQATSDKRLGTVAYQFADRKNHGALKYWVGSPMFISARVTGTGPLAALAIQVAPDATTATCTIIVDGKVASVRTVNGAFHVVVCVA